MKMGRTTRQLLNNWQKLKMRYLVPGKLTRLGDTLTIELTNRCSLACSCCPNGCDRSSCRPPHTISDADFEHLLSQIDIPFSRVFLHLHGEPFLNSDLPLIANRLIHHGVSELSVFSNGYHIDIKLLESLLNVTSGHNLHIAFSAELYSRHTYEAIRYPGRFEEIWRSMEQIDNVMKRYQKTYTVNAIVNEQAIDTLPHTVPDLFSRLQQLDEIHLNSAFPWPHLPQTGEIAGHLQSRRSICSQIWQLPVILASGEVSMCGSDYRGECIVGSLWEHRYSELINNDAARRFRRNIVLRKACRNSICADCLIDRHISFSRTVKRKFIEKANDALLQKYFAKFHTYFTLIPQ